MKISANGTYLNKCVVDMTSISLKHTVVVFPSDVERRLALMRESLSVGEDDGHDFNCLADSLLQLL